MRAMTLLIITTLLLVPLSGCLDSFFDDDGDGVGNDDDNCLVVENPLQTDTDMDGIGDKCDDDDDGDGVLDTNDIFPLDLLEYTDLDADGIGDNADMDDDNDGFKDLEDSFPRDSSEQIDTDMDGIGNNADTDDDNDGVLDTNDIFPLDLLEYTDLDADGIGDNADMDDDNDGVLDLEDSFPRDSSEQIDTDMDGIGDNADTDDDNDGVLDLEDSFPRDSSEQIDTDMDGIGDNADTDDDNDGFIDSEDQFPLDDSEWGDFDEDGVGDNADTDDDDDGVLDLIDSNDFADTGFILTFDTIRINEQMDYFDSYGEIYICLHWNFDYLENWAPMDYIYSCIPGDGYWTLEDYTTYDISGFSTFIDLPEQYDSHDFGLSVWDSDDWEDDAVDINPNSDYNFYYFEFLSQSTDEIYFNADGAGDGQGWDGILTFSVQPIDVRLQDIRQFAWTYDDLSWSYEAILEYSTYTAFRDLDHSTRGIDYIEDYARFSTPGEQYVIDIANDLENMAIQNGYTSELEIAEFIFAFVGAIEYQYDSEGMGQNDYPKYPIEMLWHQAGDCEDSAALYISLVESIGFDAMLMVGLVKPNSEEDWGGHAWAVIYIPDHSGDGWYGTGSKSDIPFYFVETTAYYSDSEIGVNPWYDVTDISSYDVE